MKEGELIPKKKKKSQRQSFCRHSAKVWNILEEKPHVHLLPKYKKLL